MTKSNIPGHADGWQRSAELRRWPIGAWKADSEFWSADRAEKRIVGPYELVAFDIPAGADCPAEIGWELFGGPSFLTQLATGRTATFDQAKAAAEAALARRLRTSRRMDHKCPGP
jgi:hypothetical protein